MPSPYAYTVYTSTTSGQTDFQFTWPYIKEEHVKLYVNYNEISQGSGSSQFQVITNVSPKLVRLNTGLSSANLRVEVRRISSLDTPLVDYADGSTLTATDLDTSSLQSLYIAQELDDNQSRNVAIDTSTALPSLNNQRLTNVSNPTAAQDAATKSYVDTNDALQLSRSGGTMTGDIVTGGNRITGLPNPASASEPVTKSYFEGQSWSGSDTLESTDTWASNNSKIATTGAIDGRIDSVIESDVLAGTDLAKTASGGQVTINHSVSGANSTVNNSDGNVLQDITISAQGHVTAIGSTNLDSRYYTETELTSGGVLDGRYYTKTSADSTFYKLGSAGEIQSGETWSSSDSKVATTAAIDARITDLVDDVGGFVPIASETNFPTANPDVNNGAGTLLSIKEIGTTRTPSSGTVTIANGSGSNTVTITGCGSTVLTAGFGVIVETTSTLHTYSFHRLTPKATEVTTVAGISANITTVAGNTTNINSVASNATNINSVAGISSNVTTVAGISSNVTSVAGNETNINAVNSNSTNINLVAGSISNVNTVGGSIANVNTVATNISGVNSFGERYRVASSDPTSDLDEGDLVFNTTTNQLRVYNGSSWQGGVTATGDLIAKTGDTFSGAIGIIAGTTGSPGLYISGDTDTGIHSPGANTIALIASGSNILQAGSSGITVNGTATATAFSGPLTGNVTGNASGSAATVTGAAQSAITSLGTLTGLTIDGDLTLTGAANNVVWDKSANSLLFADDAYAKFGAANDLQIHHSGSHSFIQDAGTGSLYLDSSALRVRNYANSNTMAQFIGDGAVELYHNNSKKLDTNSWGVKGYGYFAVDGSSGYAYTAPDNAKVSLGTGNDLQIYHDGSNSYIKDAGTGWLVLESNNLRINSTGSEPMANFTEDGGVELYHDNVKKISTTASGIEVSSTSGMSGIVISTTAASDAEIEFINTNSDNRTWAIGLDQSDSKSFVIANNAAVGASLSSSERALVADVNGAVELYHDNTKRLETTAAGVTVTGTVSDSKGNLRSIPLNTQSSAYTAAASDAGKTISISSGGVTIAASTFAAGDALSIINNSGSDQTITCSAITMYLANDTTAKTSLTLAARGMATMYFLSSGTAYSSGAGLS